MISRSEAEKRYIDKKKAKQNEINEVLNFLASWYDVPSEMFLYSSKNHPALELRRIAIYLVWSITNAPISMISRRFGYADHSSFRKHIEIIEQRKRTDKKLLDEINEIWDKFMN